MMNWSIKDKKDLLYFTLTWKSDTDETTKDQMEHTIRAQHFQLRSPEIQVPVFHRTLLTER